jgi:hypothetical protein
MEKGQVKIDIQGIPPEWFSWKIEGDKSDIVEALYYLMHLDKGLFPILEEACNKYKNKTTKCTN